MKEYRFECIETNEDGTQSIVSSSFTTENETWSGFDGPMWKFYEFLKGCGFIFGINDEIGIMREKFKSRGFDSTTESDFVPASE